MEVDLSVLMRSWGLSQHSSGFTLTFALISSLLLPSFLPSFFCPSQVLTKDSVTVSVDAVVYYRVSNATISVANVENAHHSTRLLAQTTLRNILGTKNLHEILSDRESISGSMQVCNEKGLPPFVLLLMRVSITTDHFVCVCQFQQYYEHIVKSFIFCPFTPFKVSGTALFRAFPARTSQKADRT